MSASQRIGLFSVLIVCCALAHSSEGRYPIRALQPAPAKDLKAFNEHLKRVIQHYPSIKKSPLALIKRLPVEPVGYAKAYHWCGAIKEGKQICTFREENIPDRSVAGVLQKITFKPTNQGWYAASIERAWRCQPGKGNSKAYQTELCD